MINVAALFKNKSARVRVRKIFSNEDAEGRILAGRMASPRQALSLISACTVRARDGLQARDKFTVSPCENSTWSTTNVTSMWQRRKKKETENTEMKFCVVPPSSEQDSRRRIRNFFHRFARSSDLDLFRRKKKEREPQNERWICTQILMRIHAA